MLKSLKYLFFFVAKVNTGIKYKIRSSPNKIQNPTQKIKKRNKEAPIEEKTYSEQVKPRPRLPSNAEQIKPRPRLPSNAEQIKTRPRLLSIIQDWKSRTSNSTACHKSGPEECREEGLLDDDIYEGLDVDPTLLLHGLESDWIEEEMSDDDDFKYNLTCNIRLCHIVVSPRKDVLEVKMLKHLESIGYQPTFQVKVNIPIPITIPIPINLIPVFPYQHLDRWTEGPQHNGVFPVIVFFREEADRTDFYSVCRDGLKKTSLGQSVGGMEEQGQQSDKSFTEVLMRFEWSNMVRLLVTY